MTRNSENVDWEEFVPNKCKIMNRGFIEMWGIIYIIFGLIVAVVWFYGMTVKHKNGWFDR